MTDDMNLTYSGRIVVENDMMHGSQQIQSVSTRMTAKHAMKPESSPAENGCRKVLVGFDIQRYDKHMLQA